MPFGHINIFSWSYWCFVFSCHVREISTEKKKIRMASTGQRYMVIMRVEPSLCVCDPPPCRSGLDCSMLDLPIKLLANNIIVSRWRLPEDTSCWRSSWRLCILTLYISIKALFFTAFFSFFCFFFLFIFSWGKLKEKKLTIVYHHGCNLIWRKWGRKLQLKAEHILMLLICLNW